MNCLEELQGDYCSAGENIREYSIVSRTFNIDLPWKLFQKFLNHAKYMESMGSIFPNGVDIS